MQVGIKKSPFSNCISLQRVLSTMRPSGVVNRVPPDHGKLVTLIGAVCVQYSIETHLALLLVPFVAAPLCDSDDGILMGTYMCVTQECSLE